MTARITIHRTLILPHVHEEQSHSGEGGGIDGEGPQQSGGQAAGEHPPALLLQALPYAVRDAFVLVDAAYPVGLEAGLDDVHRVGGEPGGDAGHAAREQKLGNHVRVVRLAAQRAREDVVGQEVEAEGWRLSNEGGDHAPVHAPQALLVVDSQQAVQRVLVELPLGLLLARALHLHARLGQLHGAANDGLDGACR